MQTNIIWTGNLCHSIENCLLTKTASGNEISSTIIGYYNNEIYKVDYQIKTNNNWETVFLTLRSRIDNADKSLILEKKDGVWIMDGMPRQEFANIFDIDIYPTPFTNTLAINRLKLKDRERQVIEVLYFDIPEKEVKPVKQIYTRLKEDRYLFENYDKSFKAEIKTDGQGLVVDYPNLFEMAIKNETNYATL